MAREKTPAPVADTADSVDETAARVDAPAAPVDAKPIATTRTRDRDPAERLDWKRERAKQLGIPRD